MCQDLLWPQSKRFAGQARNMLPVVREGWLPLACSGGCVLSLLPKHLGLFGLFILRDSTFSYKRKLRAEVG